jgi:D-alanine-D-alanine ligase
MDAMTVGVVFGGRSVEHDVSIVTAHQVMAVLAAEHKVVPIYVTREGRWLTAPALNDLAVYKEQRWAEAGEECVLAPGGSGTLVVRASGRFKQDRTVQLDCVVPAIHGTFGEDGTVQGLLELADVAYTGSGVTASGVGMDKRAMKAAFRDAGLPVVPDVVVPVERLDKNADKVMDEIESALGYPAFVKPSRLGSSVGIGKARDRNALRDALDVARRYDDRLIVEKAMEGCIEVNCSVLGGVGFEPQASVCEQPVAWEEFLSFTDKYMRGGKSATGKAPAGESQASAEGSKGMASQDRRIPAPISEALTKQVQDNALRAFAAIHASGVARIDSFVDEASGQTWVMEINTIPGSFSFYLWEASGKPFKRLMDDLLGIALATHQRRSELMFSFDSGMLEGLQHGEGTKSG